MAAPLAPAAQVDIIRCAGNGGGGQCEASKARPPHSRVHFGCAAVPNLANPSDSKRRGRESSNNGRPVSRCAGAEGRDVVVWARNAAHRSAQTGRWASPLAAVFSRTLRRAHPAIATPSQAPDLPAGAAIAAAAAHLPPPSPPSLPPLTRHRCGPLACRNTAAAPLFTPYTLPGGLQLQHRIVYAPLTRCRAFNNIPQARRAWDGSWVLRCTEPTSMVTPWLRPHAGTTLRCRPVHAPRCLVCSPMPRCTTASVPPRVAS